MVRRFCCTHRPIADQDARVYAFLAIYLLVCSLALTVKAFSVSSFIPWGPRRDNNTHQNIPSELKNKTTSEVIATFFKPPVGALIAAMVSTFGIYLAASILYVSLIQLCSYRRLLTDLCSVILGTCSLASSSTCVWLPASPMSSTSTHSATCMMSPGVPKVLIRQRHSHRSHHPK